MSRDPFLLERQLRLEHLARALEAALRAVHDDAEHVRRFAEHLFRNRASFGALPARIYAVHPETGVTYAPKDEGGSALIVSSRTKITPTITADIALGEHLDPLLFDVLRRNPSVVQVYFNTEETVCRIAPWFDVPEATKLKLLAPDFDVRSPEFPFYHRANAANNPERRVAWTGQYLDPLGRGWMVSCVAPVYPDGASLRGVVGLDVTVSRLAEHLGVHGNRDPILLVSSEGAVLVASSGAADLIGAGAARLDASAAGREVAAAVASGAEGSRIVGERHIVWRRIAETGWTIIHLFPRRESYEELEQRSRVLGLAQRLLSRGAADVAAVAAHTTREALDADGVALWWTEGLRFRRVAADGGGETLGPTTFAAVPHTMAAAAATPGRAAGAGTARLDLALGSPGQTLGFLAVSRTAAFTEDDARFFELIGYTAALGLENVAQFRRLAQAQKMEGLGAVAAAVAHDFNNLLGSILGNASLLRLSVPQVDEHTRRLIDIIESSAERGASLTRQLLQFTRGGAPKREVVAVSTLFTDALAFIRQSLPKNIRVEVVLPPALPAVEIDRVQMEQVLVNLCINARDAMPQGGVLVLEASAQQPPAELASSPAGRWVAMEIRDTGVGMPPEVLDRVFDPFFTTKPLGKGTGLGLPIAQRIVRDHQGAIDLMSEPGRGTTVRVYLPATGLEPAVPVAGAPEAIRTGHGEPILVVDDEPAVLAVVTDALHQAGYAPLAASSGPEALRLASSRKADLRLMVLDLLMPEMSGIELLRKMREIAPELRVLVTSGYVQPSVEPALMELGVDGILEKPFTSAALLERVRRAMADKGTGKRTPTPKIRMSPKRENRSP